MYVNSLSWAAMISGYNNTIWLFCLNSWDQKSFKKTNITHVSEHEPRVYLSNNNNNNKHLQKTINTVSSSLQNKMLACLFNKLDMAIIKMTKCEGDEHLGPLILHYCIKIMAGMDTSELWHTCYKKTLQKSKGKGTGGNGVMFYEHNIKWQVPVWLNP